MQSIHSIVKKPKPKNIFIIHSRCPSQFTPIFDLYAGDPEYNIYCISCTYTGKYKGVCHIAIGDFVDKSLECNAIVVMSALGNLQAKGIYPDMIIMHVGFGYDTYVRKIYTEIPIIGYFEWYYKELTISNIIRNTDISNRVEECSICITPTIYQKNAFPPSLKHRMMIIHEGVDTLFFSPKSYPPTMRENYTITYVSRGLEPMRRFIEFIKIIKVVLERMNNVKVIIVGNDHVYYTDNINNISLKEEANKILGALTDRVVYRGWIPKEEVRNIMQESDLHIYFTRPFVLSWSLLEAMSTGCPIIGAGEPVAEFINHGANGWLVNPDDVESSYEMFREVLLMPAEQKNKIRNAARSTVLDRVDTEKSKLKWKTIIQGLLSE